MREQGHRASWENRHYLDKFLMTFKHKYINEFQKK